MTFLYFSYGSNLLRQRLQLANPSAVFITNGQLKDYSLTFSNLGMDPSTMRWRGGAASIVERAGGTVWGCVWRLSNADLPSLDSQESLYEALDVVVTGADTTQHVCRTYRLPSSYLGLTSLDNRPSPMYMDVIIRGAIQNHLPSEYIDYLKGIETNGLNIHSEVYNDVLKMLAQSQ